jgi:hypothetical protein
MKRILTKGLLLAIWSCSLASPNAGAEASTLPRVLPFKQNVQFGPGCSANSWIGYVKSHPGETAYEFLVLPEEDLANHLIGWQAFFYSSGDRNKNLLEPRGTWHGLQPFMIMAEDLQAGPGRSTFGAKRTINIPQLGLVVSIEVASVSTQAEPDGTVVFGNLALVLSVSNASH